MKVAKALISWILEIPLNIFNYTAHQLVIQNLRSRGIHISRLSVIQGSNRLTSQGSVNIGAFGVLWCGDDPHGPLKNGKLQFGNNVYIGEHCNIRAAGCNISIGSNVLIANNVTIISSNHGINQGSPMIEQAWTTPHEELTVGDNVWIGAHAILLPGSRVSNGAVIAAGAVVRSFVPQNEIWGGVPAKKIRDR